MKPNTEADTISPEDLDAASEYYDRLMAKILSKEKVRAIPITKCHPHECRFCEMDGRGDHYCIQKPKSPIFLGSYLPKVIPNWCPLPLVTLKED